MSKSPSWEEMVKSAHCNLISNVEYTTGQCSHCALSTHRQLFCGLSEDMHILHRILWPLFACRFETCKRRAPTQVTAAPAVSPPLARTGLPGTRSNILPQLLTPGTAFRRNKTGRFLWRQRGCYTPDGSVTQLNKILTATHQTLRSMEIVSP